jgi:hypothetical protein
MTVRKNCEVESGRDVPFVDGKHLTSDGVPPADSTIIPDGQDVFRVGHLNGGGDDISVSDQNRRKSVSTKVPNGNSSI